MKKLTVRPSDREFAILSLFCEQTERTQNDVMRELIRSIEDKLTPESKQLLANQSKADPVS